MMHENEFIAEGLGVRVTLTEEAMASDPQYRDAIHYERN